MNNEERIKGYRLTKLHYPFLPKKVRAKMKRKMKERASDKLEYRRSWHVKEVI